MWVLHWTIWDSGKKKPTQQLEQDKWDSIIWYLLVVTWCQTLCKPCYMTSHYFLFSHTLHFMLLISVTKNIWGSENMCVGLVELGWKLCLSQLWEPHCLWNWKLGAKNNRKRIVMKSRVGKWMRSQGPLGQSRNIMKTQLWQKWTDPRWPNNGGHFAQVILFRK